MRARRPIRHLTLALIATAPACGPFRPVAIFDSGESALRSVRAGEVAVTWRPSPAAGRTSVLRVSLLRGAAASGDPAVGDEVQPQWRRVQVVDGDVVIAEYAREGDDDPPATLDVPIRAPIASLRLIAEEDDGVPREWRMELAAREVAWHETPARVEEPSTLATITYPLWGLPRDLLDAPLTGLNRLGLGRLVKPDEDAHIEREPLASGLVTLGALTGGAWGFAWGLAEAGPHLLQILFFIEVGGAGGAAAGGIAGAVTDVLLGVTLPPLQTWLLRTGVDGDPWKGDTPEVLVPRTGWDDDALAAWDRQQRSLGYFPNWRFVARGERYEAPSAGPGARGVVIDDVRLFEVGPATPTSAGGP